MIYIVFMCYSYCSDRDKSQSELKRVRTTALAARRRLGTTTRAAREVVALRAQLDTEIKARKAAERYQVWIFGVIWIVTLIS